MVGQLNVKNPRPLSPELEEFVNKSIHGFIVVSFGTNVAFLSKKKVDLLAAAFGKLQQNVVWKLKGEISNVYKIMKDTVPRIEGSLYVSGKLPTYPSPNSTLTLTSHLGQNVGLGEGWVSIFPETYNDLNKASE